MMATRGRVGELLISRQKILELRMTGGLTGSSVAVDSPFLGDFGVNGAGHSVIEQRSAGTEDSVLGAGIAHRHRITGFAVAERGGFGGLRESYNDVGQIPALQDEVAGGRNAVQNPGSGWKLVHNIGISIVDRAGPGVRANALYKVSCRRSET